MSATESASGKRRDTNWVKVLWYIHLHAFGLYGIIACFSAKWPTLIFAVFLTLMSHLGITLGAHRLWAHQALTASWPVRLFLVIGQTFAGVGSVRNWVLDHRMHHKYHNTENDPHDHRKGFLYSHINSNIVKSPDYDKLASTIDMRDIDGDIILLIQHKLYSVWFLVFGILLPINTPVEYWDESLVQSIFILGALRLAVAVNIASLVHSGLLIWGLKETDKYPPDDNLVYVISRTFWPHYHYLVPWDAKTDEFGSYDNSFSSFTMKVWSELGLVQEMKTTYPNFIEEALYSVATKKMTLEAALEKLKEQCEFVTRTESLKFHH